jgi:hypothetical protein
LSLHDTTLPAFEPDLFNTEAYARLHASRFFGSEVRSEYFRAGHNMPTGVFHAMQVLPGLFISPGRGPYGGFDISSELDEAELAVFIAKTEARLRQCGAHRVELVLPPFCYAPHCGPRTLALLCRLGYCVIRQELNQALNVGEKCFAVQGNYANRKRLNKANRAGILVRRLNGEECREGYDAIHENRIKKDRSLSMSWQDVQQMQAAFPDRVFHFGAEQHGRIIAAAICMAVNRRTLYVYAWGERVGAESVSPVTSIAAHLFEFAQRGGFTLLDLGTSSVDGIVNPGLLRFKESLGATTSLKLSLGKALA